MNTYNGYSFRTSVTAAFASVVAVTCSILLSATCLVDTTGTASQTYSIVTPQA